MALMRERRVLLRVEAAGAAVERPRLAAEERDRDGEDQLVSSTAIIISMRVKPARRRGVGAGRSVDRVPKGLVSRVHGFSPRQKTAMMVVFAIGATRLRPVTFTVTVT